MLHIMKKLGPIGPDQRTVGSPRKLPMTMGEPLSIIMR